MNLDDLRLFAMVARTGSFTRAAAALGLPKQTVSRRVAALENSLGVQLLHRTTRRVRLTESGSSYAHRCQELVRLAELASREVSDQQCHGTLRLTADQVFGEYFLSPLLIEFALERPGIRLETELTTRMVDLVEEGFDLAIRVGSPSAGALELGPATIRYCASPEYLSRRGQPASVQELLQHECLICHHDQWPFAGVGRVQVSGRFRCNSFAIMRQACLRGLGIALFPGFACAQEIFSGRLLPVLDQEVPPVGSVYLLQPPGRPSGTLTRSYVNLLLRAFERPAW